MHTPVAPSQREGAKIRKQMALLNKQKYAQAILSGAAQLVCTLRSTRVLSTLEFRTKFMVRKVRRAVEDTLSVFKYEPNDAFTRREVQDILNGFLEQVMTKINICGYKVVCDEINNTPDSIDKNELHVDVYLKVGTNMVPYNFWIRAKGDVNGI